MANLIEIFWSSHGILLGHRSIKGRELMWSKYSSKKCISEGNPFMNRDGANETSSCSTVLWEDAELIVNFCVEMTTRNFPKSRLQSIEKEISWMKTGTTRNGNEIGGRKTRSVGIQHDGIRRQCGSLRPLKTHPDMTDFIAYCASSASHRSRN
jgi:hypothetical protein